MSGSNNQVVIFDNFTGGDYGQYGSIKPPPNTFSGENVLVYANGLIGPRGGLKNQTPTGMPTGSLISFMATPVVGKGGFFIVNDQPYYFDLYSGGGATAWTGTMDSTPSQPLLPFLDVDTFYLAVPGDQTYQIPVPTATITGLTGSPSGDLVVRLGDRLIVGTSNSSNQIKFSNAGDFNTWDSANFINVDDAWQITALSVQRNWLTIFKRNSVLIMTGVPGVNDFIRRESTTVGPLHPWQAVVDEDDIAYFIPIFRESPAKFVGAIVTQLPWLKFMDSELDDTTPTLPIKRGVTTVVGDLTASTTVFAQGDGTSSGNDLLLCNHNGYWTKHHTEVHICGGVTSDLNERLLLTDGGPGSIAATFYSTQFDLNRPSFTSDQFTQPGDNSTTPFDAYFSLPEWWSPDGREVAVRQVTVDFTKWNTGSGSTNHFEIVSNVIGQFSVPGIANPADSPAVFDEAGSAAASTQDGTRDRFIWNCQVVRGAGFSIDINAIRGVAIRSITVELELFPELPRF